MEWVDVVAIGSDPRLVNRIEAISKFYDLSQLTYSDALALAKDYGKGSKGKICIMGIDKAKDFASIIGEVQTVRQAQREAFLVLIIAQKVAPEDFLKLKQNGADLVFIESEAYYSSKLEYTISQKVRSVFIPIKTHELLVDTAPNIKIFHVMPLNQKFLAVNHPGQKISQAKYDKMSTIGEMYIHRKDLEVFKEYVSSSHLENEQGDLARCRGHFVSLSLSFIDLVLLILDESEARSFDAGKNLYSNVVDLANSLLNHLDKTIHPWDIINHSSVGDFGAVVRSPAIASYAGLLSRRSGIGDPTEIMISALVSDVGLLEMSPETTAKLTEVGEADLPAEYLAEFRLHPIKSLNACLSRRLPLPENVKTYITTSHERTDGNGYPSKMRSEKIPIEAQLIQFCQLIDEATMVKMGQRRRPWKEVAQQVFEQEYQSQTRFSVLLLENIRKFFL